MFKLIKMVLQVIITIVLAVVLSFIWLPAFAILVLLKQKDNEDKVINNNKTK